MVRVVSSLLIALSVVIDILCYLTHLVQIKTLRKCENNPFYCRNVWRISSGKSIELVGHFWGPFSLTGLFQLWSLWQSREKLDSLCWDAATVSWEMGVGHSGCKIQLKHVLSALRHLKIHLQRVCPLLLPWHLFGRKCKIFFVIQTRATELGNSLSSHYVWCLTLEWNGLRFAKGPSENKLLKNMWGIKW